MGTGKHLLLQKRRAWIKILQDRNTLIEQSVEAQTTLIEHSNPHLETPFENSGYPPVL